MIAGQIAVGTRPKPVVSCSALKRQYRSQLRQADPRIWFLHLVIDEAAASQRVVVRLGHFMRASLVPSQLADLEPLQAEAGLAVDATQPPEDIVTAAICQLTAQGLLGVPGPDQPRPRHDTADWSVAQTTSPIRAGDSGHSCVQTTPETDKGRSSAQLTGCRDF